MQMIRQSTIASYQVMNLWLKKCFIGDRQNQELDEALFFKDEWF